MSYDITIGDVWINHTYNGSEVCKEIIGMTPQNFDNKPACVVYELAKTVYDELSKNRLKYTQHFLKYNNWGTIDSWIDFMHEIMTTCKNNQLAFVYVG